MQRKKHLSVLGLLTKSAGPNSLSSSPYDKESCYAKLMVAEFGQTILLSLVIEKRVEKTAHPISRVI